MMSDLLERSFKSIGTVAWLLAALFAVATAVTWLAAREAIVFIAPVMVYSLAGCAMLAAAVATLAFSVERSEWLATRRAEALRDRTLAKNEARQADIASDRAQMHLMAEGRLMAAAVRQVENGLIHPSVLGEGAKFSSFPAQVINKIEQAAVPLLEAPPQPLLPAIRNCENILIVGGTRTGKTTLLQWLESERIQDGQTIALDSHAVPGQWGGQSVGAGRQYSMIKNAMIALVDKMDGRHKKRTLGQARFNPICQIIDEFTLLPGYLKQADYDVQAYSFPMLTEGRKVGMCCLWGTHSKRAKQLGLEGATDLQECFDVFVFLKKVKGAYYALCDFGEGEENIKYSLPGPFNAPDQNSNTVPETPTETATQTETFTPADLEFLVAEPDPDPSKPTPDEMAIIEAVKQVEFDHGKIIWSKVTDLLGMATGGPNNSRVKAVLDKWGISY